MMSLSAGAVRPVSRPLMLPQNAAAGGVEGHGPHVQRFCSKHPRQTLLQLVRSLVGKGHAQQISRQNAELRHQIRKPPRQRPRLAGACARDHAHKALGR